MEASQSLPDTGSARTRRTCSAHWQPVAARYWIAFHTSRRSVVRGRSWLRHLFADGGYAGDKLATALAGLGRWTLDIVKRPAAAEGFLVLPRRWVVERTFAWRGRCRRLANDFERSVESSAAWALVARIRRLTRLIARHCSEA